MVSPHPSANRRWTDTNFVSADVFDPDRFLDERTKYHTKNPFIFVPFNAGPRICLGQQVSLILFRRESIS